MVKAEAGEGDRSSRLTLSRCLLSAAFTRISSKILYRPVRPGKVSDSVGRRAAGGGGRRSARWGGHAGSTRKRAYGLHTGHVGDVALVQTDFSVVDPKLGAVHLCGPDVRIGAEQHVLELCEFLVRLLDRLLLRGLLGGVRDRVLLGEHIVVIDDGRGGALARALAERLVGLLDQCHACTLVC